MKDLVLRLTAITMVVLVICPFLGILSDFDLESIVLLSKSSAVRSALLISIKTSLTSLVLMFALGLPLAWQLSRTKSHSYLRSVLLYIPILLPPSVVGLGLLTIFGPHHVIGATLKTVGISVPFSASAVVLCQFVVGAPFFVEFSRLTFEKVTGDQILLARSLGMSPRTVFLSIIVPLSAPGIACAAAIAWARTLGEFGATLLFAGSLEGVTQTLPLAIYRFMETDLTEAKAAAVLLVGLAGIVMLAVFVAVARKRTSWFTRGHA